MAEEQQDKVVDFHREVSIMFLKSTPAFAVRTPRGQKDPGAIQWDPKVNTREKSNQTIATLERTTDNLGVHLFGNVVDVDVDTDNPFMAPALDHFLPHTNHIWGRKSRPRTHRLYELAGAATLFDPSQYPFLAKATSEESIAVEVRGGELKSGKYSLLPGSMHPSGEIYTWADAKAARSTPVQTDMSRLMNGVRMSMVAALIAPYWVEGVRNDLCKALSGFMFRAAAYSAELADDLPFDKEAAQRLLEGICLIADDDPSDRTMRLKTFEMTWEKGESGAPIVGATKIAEITGKPDIVPLLYTLLANTPDLQQLDAVFDQFAVLRNTTSIVDLDLGSRGNYVMNKDAFLFTMAGRYVNTVRGRVPIASIFLNSLRRVVVDKIAVHPAKGRVFTDRLGARMANIWTGWEIPVPPHAEEMADGQLEVACAPFKEYLFEVLANGDEAVYEWTLMWLADIFQNPADKPGTALVLVGEQGSGKSFLPEKILRPIIGNAHFVKVSTIDKLTSKFNAHMSGKLVVQGEEVMNSNRRTDADALKDAITSKVRAIEMKGRDVFEMEDYSRYVFTSNHIENSVNVGVGDRRMTITHTSEKYAYMGGRNEELRNPFWKKMHDWAEKIGEDGEAIPNVENLGLLHAWLMRVKIDKKRIMVAAETEVKKRTLHNSSRGLDGWLLSLVEMENPFDGMRENERGDDHSYYLDPVKNRYAPTKGWPTHVQYIKLEYALRLATAREYGESRSAQQLVSFFQNNGMIDEVADKRMQSNGVKIRIRPFPSRAKLVAYLRGKGYPVLDVSEAVEDEAQDNQPKF